MADLRNFALSVFTGVLAGCGSAGPEVGPTISSTGSTGVEDTGEMSTTGTVVEGSSTGMPAASSSSESSGGESSTTGEAVETSSETSSSTGEIDSGLSHVVYLYTGHGFRVGWTPQDTGPGVALSPVLEPLTPVQDQTLVVSGLGAVAPSKSGLPGPSAAPSLLTGGAVQSLGPDKCEFLDPDESTVQSVDTRFAEALVAPYGGPNGERLVRLGSGVSGSCYSGGQHPRLSWAAASEVVPTLQGLEELAGLLSDLVPAEASTSLDELLIPTLDPRDDFAEYTRRQLEMTRVAFEHDAARVATVSIGAPLTMARLTPQSTLGLGLYQHGMGSDGEYIQEFQRVTSLVADFAASLAETPYGDGSLLDHTLIVWFSDMSADAQGAHSVDNLPVVLIGNIEDRVATGGHVNLDGFTLADLHVTVANVVDVDLGDFGDPDSPPVVLGELLQ